MQAAVFWTFWRRWIEFYLGRPWKRLLQKSRREWAKTLASVIAAVLVIKGQIRRKSRSWRKQDFAKDAYIISAIIRLFLNLNFRELQCHTYWYLLVDQTFRKCQSIVFCDRRHNFYCQYNNLFWLAHCPSLKEKMKMDRNSWSHRHQWKDPELNFPTCSMSTPIAKRPSCLAIADQNLGQLDCNSRSANNNHVH